MAQQVSHALATRSAMLALLSGCLIAAAAHAQSFTLVGHAPGNANASSYIHGLSDDGRAAAGEAFSDLGWTGLLWTPDGGRLDFSHPTNDIQFGGGISGDGHYVVGAIANGNGAFRWSQEGGFDALGTIPGYAGAGGIDANYDGSVIVGTAGSGSATTAFRWTQAGGMQPLGLGTEALAVSGDGGTIVGRAGSGPTAFRWTQAGGFQGLPTLGGTGNSLAADLNFDGSIIVGQSGPQLTATMWTNGVPASLELPATGNHLNPEAVDLLGTVVAGQATLASHLVMAGVWTPSTGIIPLSDYLAANGVSIPAGINLYECTGVSADGRTFAGYTSGSSVGGIQGWVASLAPPCPADLDNDGNLSNGGTRDHAVDVSDLLYFLSAFEAGTPAADLDNGTGTRTHDGAVDVNDLLFFLAHFEAGC